MGSWSYGLVRDKEGIKVREVYFNEKKKIFAYADLDWKQYFINPFMIIKDIYSQLKNLGVLDYERDIKGNKPNWEKR